MFEAERPCERVGVLAHGGGQAEHTLAHVRPILAREGFTPIPLHPAQVGTEEERPGELAATVLCLADGAHEAASVIARLAGRPGRAPVVPVVLVCATIERRQLRGALAAGVAGVVPLDELHHVLGPCLRAVRAGQVCVPRPHWREIEPPVLSVRERQILGLVAMGYMNRQIADRLFLAESTVKSHLSSAFAKLGVRSRSEAAELILSRESSLPIGLPEPGEGTGAGTGAGTLAGAGAGWGALS